MDKQELAALLARHSEIPIHKWGRGGTKTRKALLDELLSRESELIERRVDGVVRVIRKLRAVVVRVVYEHEDECGRRYGLVETSRTPKSGSGVRIFSASLGTKHLRGEPTERAAFRALSTKLGNKAFAWPNPHPERLKRVRGRGHVIEESWSYPGLLSECTEVCFEFEMPPEYFAKTYRFREKERKVLFKWVPLHKCPWMAH